MDPLYTLQLIHPHKSDVHQIADSDELALRLNHAIIDVTQISVDYDNESGTYRTRILTPDPSSPDKRAIYEITGLHLQAAMSSLRERCPKVYQSIALM